MTVDTKQLEQDIARTRASLSAKRRMPSGDIWKRIVSTVWFSPFLLAVWWFNGWLSVKGLPTIFGVMTQTMATDIPPALLTYLWWVGWSMVFMTTYVEVWHVIRKTWFVHNGGALNPFVDKSMVVYDFGSTWLGMFLLMSQWITLSTAPQILVSALLSIPVTFGCELIVGKIWSR